MERINVAVRARPLSPEDAKTSPWRISDNSILIANPHTKFDFDRIFSQECSTFDVYESRTKYIVAAAIGGFNGTVFAYGQTNSGKTHTMRGSSVEPGVIPLAVHDLFDMIHQEMDREFLLRMSYMEIYNEEINDLLAPEHRKLQIHESIERGIFVAGLREEIVTSAKQVLEFMEFGEAHRHIGETNMNLHSSRSHTIFRMIIESRDKVEDEYAESSCDAVRVSVLMQYAANLFLHFPYLLSKNLVDLAGSERAAKTGAEGVRLKEGSHINKSLMTLGTVIKKLSEGAESQGSHVPYRDSKLTRILQPALGGNANTAIICNITLAQIHADETKSSLQFASRALRVTNCVHVNEILTDAALLKRQKKEIEELRAKLQGSHSDHLGEEILNLRNTLLQSELERERIALELEEEKKAQAEREKMLLEQAKKIQNLSSMVLCSNRDEVRDHRKKLPSTILGQASAVRPDRTDRERGPLLPFEELVNDKTSNACKLETDCNGVALSDFDLPHPHSLMHVTSRKKAPTTKRSLPMESAELKEMRAEYENLLLQFETQRTTSEIQIDYLTRRLEEASYCLDEEPGSNYTSDTDKKAIQLSTTRSLGEMEAILVIKQLQEKISELEMEKSLSFQNVDSAVELETEKNMYASNKHDEMDGQVRSCEVRRVLLGAVELLSWNGTKPTRAAELVVPESAPPSFSVILCDTSGVKGLKNTPQLYMKLLAAQEEVNLIHQQLMAMDENSEALTKLSADIQEITFDIQHSETLVGSVTSMMEEHLQSCAALSDLIADLRSFSSHDFIQIKTLLGGYEKVHSCMKAKVDELEHEKLLMYNQSKDLQKRIEEACLSGENSARALTELSERYEAETTEFLSEIKALQNEISSLSSSVLAKEKERMRKDLEKTKAKLKETEFKLRNTIQEKTKLEGEKASAEREIKRLHGQKAVLERDITKRESIAGRRRDSVLDRSSNIFDSRKAKGFGVTVDQEEYRKLEVLAFEMETTIGSLEEKLATTNDEKEQAVLNSERLVLEVQDLSDKLNFSNSELQALEDLVSSLRVNLEEAAMSHQNAENSVSKLVEEKEEMAMQLTDALLAIEEERAIWVTTEKASIEVIESKSKLYSSEIALLTDALSEVRNELEACGEECKAIKQKLAFAEEKLEVEKACSVEKSLQIDQLKNDLRQLDDQKKISEDKLRNQLLEITKERDEVLTQAEELQNSKAEQQLLVEKCHDKVKDQNFIAIIWDFISLYLIGCLYFEQFLNAKAEVEELTMKLSTLEVKWHNKAKTRMRLNGAQRKLDSIRMRCKEEMQEKDYMHKQFEDATTKLKSQLVSRGSEILNLKKQLALKA
ncbi:Kinesin, motor domain-containing protein [Cynara cardunculus var. scolymus]|uniref:Kinesin, motor domain-containing protein n=1 Tax=Cynara cardunculus var. scolymus TaxID=59895 RepID=A0A103XJC6_CYNCS|nr:Kinesin, motor domain-containing protein [Cynara cardunculus var. scolymus]